MQSPFAVVFLAVLVSACSTTEPGTKVRELAPVALTVLVEDVPQVPVGKANEGLRFTADPVAVREMLVRGLRAVDAASRVVSQAELSNGVKPDVVLRLTFQDPIELSHEGTANFLAAGGLWLVTWIGGLLVEDSAYNARLSAQCALETPGNRFIERAMGSKVINTKFLERNDFFSWSTLQSLVLPPFWTSDQNDSASEALTQRVVEMLAQDIAAVLKQDFEPWALESDGCRIELLNARNGAAVSGSTMQVQLAVAATNPIELVAVSVNDGAERMVPARSEQVAVDRYRAVVLAELGDLREDRDNLVRVRIEAGEEFTRTLRFGPRQGR